MPMERGSAVDFGASIADVFVGGVLCTLLALAMDFSPFVAGLEPGRKLIPSPRLAFGIS
jgi:hypothetical protein